MTLNLHVGDVGDGVDRQTHGGVNAERNQEQARHEHQRSVCE
jgi:hypothetical protein